MTALDTNVTVRYLVGDNDEHAEAARALLDTLTPGNPGFICREVVVEVALGTGTELPLPTNPSRGGID